MTKAYSYIRFSSPEQLKGDSLRRQLEASQKYAEDKGLIIDESFKMRDEGVSAFDKSNVERGALGGFLKAVKNGQISKGSYLIVESLDRLSRDQVLNALEQFISILNEGIIIFTLSDKMEYSRESVSNNFSELLISLTIMARAHEESKIKSMRLSAAWSNKRNQASNIKLTKWCPSWLKLSDDRTVFNVLEDRAKVVQKIYDLTINGTGKYLITRHLNETGVEPFNKGIAWHTSYITKILNNRSVLGEFQPRKRVAKKQVDVGEPITDYYPQIIDENTFYKAKEATKSRTGKAGRKGKKISNLFTGIVKCAYCGDSMLYKDKGQGYISLICSSGLRAAGCETTTWKYKSFELSALAYISEIDLNKVFSSTESSSELTTLQAHIDEVSAKTETNKFQLNRLTDLLIGEDELPKTILTKFKELELNAIQFEEELTNLRKEFITKNQSLESMENRHKSMMELLKTMKNLEGDELYDLRSKLSQEIKNIVQYISLYTRGDITKDKITPPCYMVKFNNGAIRFVEPDIDNPSKQYIMIRKMPKPVIKPTRK